MKKNRFLVCLEPYLATQRNVLNCHLFTIKLKYSENLVPFWSPPLGPRWHFTLISQVSSGNREYIRSKSDSSKARSWLTVNDQERKKLQSSLSTYLPPKTALLWAHLLCLDIKRKAFIPDVVVWLKWDEFDFKRWKFCVKKRRQKVTAWLSNIP